VGSYPLGASPYGVLDMAGNVANWTTTVWAPYPYDPKDGREDRESFLRWRRGFVNRGGTAFGDRDGARCADRGFPYLGVNTSPYVGGVGFRVALGSLEVTQDKGGATIQAEQDKYQRRRDRRDREARVNPAALSRDEQACIPLVDALADDGKREQATKALVRRPQAAAKVLTMALQGRVGSDLWRSAGMMDDIGLDALWKLEKAIVALGSVAAPYVRPLLNDDRWPVQFMAINALGDLKDKESLPEIVKLLQPSNGRISMAAAEALGKIADPAAIPYLEEALKQATWWGEREIAEALRACRGL